MSSVRYEIKAIIKEYISKNLFSFCVIVIYKEFLFYSFSFIKLEKVLFSVATIPSIRKRRP